MRSRFIMVFIISFSIVVSILFLYNMLAMDYRVEYVGEYEYNVSINSNDTYAILVPCVVDHDGKLNTELMDNLTILGDCTYSILSNEKGKFHNISGNGDLEIRSKCSFSIEKGDYIRTNFSPELSSLHKNDSLEYRYCCWVFYSNKSNASQISIEIEFRESTDDYFYNGLGQGGWNSGYSGYEKTNGSLTKGWHELPMERKGVCADAFVGWRFYSPVSIFFIIGTSGSIASIVVMFCILWDKRKNKEASGSSFIKSLGLLFMIFYIFSLTELYFVTDIIYLGEPSVMNVFQVSTRNNLVFIIPILLINLIGGVIGIIKINKIIDESKKKQELY